MRIAKRKVKKESKRWIVTLEMVRKELRIVEREYEKLGLIDHKLDGVEVYLVPLGVAYGWKWSGKKGWIDIPRVSIHRVAGLMFHGKTVSLRDVMRHEMAHGLADTHRALIRSRKYRENFVYPYDDNYRQIYDPKFHVSEYAAKDSAEDFAETVMWYVKSKGVVPKRWVGSGIHAKYEFIRELSEAITDGRARW